MIECHILGTQISRAQAFAGQEPVELSTRRASLPLGRDPTVQTYWAPIASLAAFTLSAAIASCFEASRRTVAPSSNGICLCASFLQFRHGATSSAAISSVATASVPLATSMSSNSAVPLSPP
eukprot:scaffold856_cov326-Pavlova_lutheri.AAC.16